MVNNIKTSEGTQMCTVDSVKRKAMEYMGKDFIIDGIAYNMNALGWKFSFNNTKTTFGQCSKSIRRNFSTSETYMTNKSIKLSEWMIINSDVPFEKWVDTILHEIAHAIDSEINADCKSSHGYSWVRIAKMIGCNGERCGSAKVDARASKYTLKCISCGREKASHKKKRKVLACGKCCVKFNNSRYSLDYKFEQIQNY
tara:strand:+ start:198 stop:791 length:594 start_codon:yes stop_codon:yes gene_type:complete